MQWLLQEICSYHFIKWSIRLKSIPKKNSFKTVKSSMKFTFEFNLSECDRLLTEFIPTLCTIINTSSSRSSAQIALDTIKNVLEEIKLDMLRHVSLLEKIAHSVQKVLAYKVWDFLYAEWFEREFRFVSFRLNVNKRMMMKMMKMPVEIIEIKMVEMMQNTMQCWLQLVEIFYLY